MEVNYYVFVIWLISFIAVVLIFKFIVNGFMNFMGADWYSFSVAGRTFTCGLISLVVAFLIYALIYG